MFIKIHHRLVGLVLILLLVPGAQAATVADQVRERLAMGEKTNRLINEKSPYLLQHAFNPVDWYPWGEEVFKRARDENKPVFLSIGYSTCHWCHVMEKESFENPEIAALLNKWFICIKVDREERPDIDQMYMAATQAMTGSGGWPMSVFLFPDGKPFYAGTYFPPQALYGRPGFGDILAGIHDAWINKRADLHDAAVGLVRELEKRAQASVSGKLDREILDRAYAGFANDYNQAYGGFSYAPKFPRPVQFNFLFRYWHRTGIPQARDMVLQTLQYMRKGGIWDHVGGGFHRYATDPQWRVPHFEKMLYDQAQLASTYLDAYQITGEQQYADTAAGIFEYVLRDMTFDGGAFYSAEDADSDDPYSPGNRSEGAFYLWTEKEIKAVLAEEDVPLFMYRFGIKEEGNAPEDPQGEFKGKNILYLAHSLEQTALKFNRTAESVHSSLEKSLTHLLKVRSGRKRPHLDDKVLVSWNGLMISALARGSAALDDRRLLNAAVRAARFIRNTLYDTNSGELKRRFRAGESGLAGQLEDYAFLVAGLIDLYQVGQDPAWLEWAIALTKKQIELFWDNAGRGFFDSIGDPALPFRMKGDYDGAEPAGNSVAAMNLLLLGAVTSNTEWTEKGKACTEIFSTRINAQPKMLPRMLCAFDQSRSKPQQVVIAGRRGRDDSRAMMAEVFKIFEPGRMVLLADDGPNEMFLTRFLPFIGNMDMLDDRATAYVCRDFTCRKPVSDTDRLKLQLTGGAATR
jgi:uncharacterized protein YyaL (SSP411 family)